jgi:hypothetical protein
MNTVILPFEIGQPCYREAYVYAVKCARNLGAELILLHTFEFVADNEITPDRYDQLIKNSWLRAYKEIILFHDYYLQDVARVDSELRIKADHRFIHGKLMVEFTRILKREEIDLVVLPASSDSDSTKKKLNLLRREALSAGLTSLLVTPHSKEYQPVNHILFLYSSKRLKNISAHVNDLCSFAGLFNSSIHLVKISRDIREDKMAENEIRQAFSDRPKMQHQVFFHAIGRPDAKGQLMNYISEQEIHMLAVTRHQLHIVGEKMWSDIFEELCIRSHLPVLILRDHKGA